MVNNLYGNDHRMIAILKILSESDQPLGSYIVSRELERAGIKLSASSVRYLFRITDIRGYTQSVARDGRMLTPCGLEKLKSAHATEYVTSSVEEDPAKTVKLQRIPRQSSL
jgi:repressor of nif and glnA expression